MVCEPNPASLKSDCKKLPWQTSVEEWLQKAALADISWRVTTKGCLGRHWLKSDYKKLPWQTSVEEWLQKAALADISWRVTTKSCLGRCWLKSDYKKLPWQTLVEEWLQKAALANVGLILLPGLVAIDFNFYPPLSDSTVDWIWWRILVTNLILFPQNRIIQSWRCVCLALKRDANDSVFWSDSSPTKALLTWLGNWLNVCISI